MRTPTFKYLAVALVSADCASIWKHLTKVGKPFWVSRDIETNVPLVPGMRLPSSHISMAPAVSLAVPVTAGLAESVVNPVVGLSDYDGVVLCKPSRLRENYERCTIEMPSFLPEAQMFYGCGFMLAAKNYGNDDTLRIMMMTLGGWVTNAGECIGKSRGGKSQAA